jgi:hypothetical protein
VTEPSEQLEWETRWAKPAAFAAFGSAILTVAGNFYAATALESRPEPGDSKGFAEALVSESGVFVISSVIPAIGAALLPLALVYLYGVVKARRPELPTVALYLAVAGPLIYALAIVLSQFERIDNAEQFIASGSQDEGRAEEALRDQGALSVAVGLSGALSLGFALVLLNVNAMRAGIESRFMGVMGVVVGALPVLSSLVPVISASFVQLFWVTALGALFLGKWPGGRGPAWETGEATPWPSAADRRLEQAEAPAGAANRDEPHPPGSPTSQKRKRKRKR